MNIANSLNGSVYSQGIKINYVAWLDMGSAEWQETDPKLKAAAYQAALVCGWTDTGLKNFILNEFKPRIDNFMADVTIETLQELSKEYPIEVEKVYEAKEDKPVYRR